MLDDNFETFHKIVREQLHLMIILILFNEVGVNMCEHVINFPQITFQYVHFW